MEKIFFASHGSLADGMVSALEMIAGRFDNVRAFSLDKYETPCRIQREISAEIGDGDTCVILCDIKGGSVHNQLMELALRPNVTIITGMNLAMAVELAASVSDLPPREKVCSAAQTARDNVAVFDSAVIAEMLAANSNDEL